jgi:hypothetical protein
MKLEQLRSSCTFAETFSKETGFTKEKQIKNTCAFA